MEARLGDSLMLTRSHIYAKAAELRQGDLNHNQQVSAAARGSLCEGRSAGEDCCTEASRGIINVETSDSESGTPSPDQAASRSLSCCVHRCLIHLH